MRFRHPIKPAPLLPTTSNYTDEEILVAMKKLHYLVLASLKMDGIRGCRADSSLVSVRLKHIPNRAIRKYAADNLPAGFDMELWNRDMAYNEIESIVMSHEHPDSDKIHFHVIDWFGLEGENTYADRCKKIMHVMCNFDQERVKFAPPIECHNAEQLLMFFKLCEEHAGEGICFRLPDSPYKQGRSTLTEQYLIKLCRFAHEEATIVGFEEQMENGAPDQRNRTGNMDRSKKQEYMYGKDTLGALVVKKDDQTFKIGTGVGLTTRLRKEIWDNQDKYMGKGIVYKCKPHGKLIKPRSPIFKGFRNTEIDG